MAKKPVKAATKPKTAKPKTARLKSEVSVAASAKPKASKAKPAPTTTVTTNQPVPPAPQATADVLDRLFAVVTQRRTANPAHSHSARLLGRGTAKVAQKFGEEAVECLIEAVAGNTDALVAESADVLYHLLVMWVATGVTPERVWAELERREGVSGVAEKAARGLPIGTTKIP